MQYAGLRDPRCHIPVNFKEEAFDKSKHQSSSFSLLSGTFDLFTRTSASSATHTDSGTFSLFLFLYGVIYQLCDRIKIQAA